VSAALPAATAGRRGFRLGAAAVAAGCLLFPGLLVPTLGLVQVGEPADAARHTYFPQLGLFLALVRAAADLAELRLDGGDRAAAVELLERARGAGAAEPEAAARVERLLARAGERR
jgi:hypothetical protein